MLMIRHDYNRPRSQRGSTLSKQNVLKAVISTRKERQKSKRIALIDQLLLTTEELQKAAIECEKRKGKRSPRKRKMQSPVSQIASEDGEVEGEEVTPEEIVTEDCIVVAQRK